MKALLAIWVLLVASACASLSNRDPLVVDVAGIEPLPGESMEIRLQIAVRIQNPNDTPVEYRGAALDLSLNGRRAASGVSDQIGTVPRYGETVIYIPVTISGHRTSKLRFSSTSEYGCYVKAPRGPAKAGGGAIEWTDSTFNPWIGCTNVSPGCDHCYAEAMNAYRGWTEWGPHGERRRTSAATWHNPRKWQSDAQRFRRVRGRRQRVFCASLADVFDNKVPGEWRADLFALIRATPDLDWQLLTKRPMNIAKMLPTDWGGGYPNVWLGATMEDQLRYDQRWQHLRSVPAAVRFVSYGA